MRFDEFDLHDDILEAISYMGFEKASPIQEKAIPAILDNKDILAFAQTGTGKTAAFLLPILDKIADSTVDAINTVIIVPTRELAIQIDQQIQGFSYFVPTNSIALYGGGDGEGFSREQNALTSKTDIIVATPGKLIAHLNLGYVDLSMLEHLVLDEADRMLDMGFNEDIQRIISYMPKNRQTLFFSATMPPKIKKLAQDILYKPEEIIIELSKPAKGVLQAVYLAYDTQKDKLINQLIANNKDYKSILIFTSTKAKVSQIARNLKSKDYVVKGISSDLEQKERESVLAEFRSKKTRVLVATDVLSRGIDIKDINLVINYDVPGDAEDYVHRVGRTARADTEGVALTLVNPDDMYKLLRIERLIEADIMKIPLPVELGEGPKWNPKPETRNKKPFKKNNKKSFNKRNNRK